MNWAPVFWAFGGSGTTCAASLLVTASLLSCAVGQPCPRNWEGLRKETQPRQLECARGLDTDDLIEVYLLSVFTSEPPTYQFLDELAQRGVHAVEPILRTISRSTTEFDDAPVPELLIVFRRMRRLGTYDITSDPSAITRLHARIEEMRNAPLKRWAQRLVLDLQAPGSE